MAEETQPKPAEAVPAAAAADPPAAEPATEKKTVEEEKKPDEQAAPAAAEAEEKPAAAATPAEEASEAAAEAVADKAGVSQSVSFKEESNVVADLEDPEKKALDELKQLIQAALVNKEFTPPLPPPPPPAPAAEETPAKVEEVKAEEANATEEEAKTTEEKTEETKTTEEKTEEAKTTDEKTEEVKTEEKAEEVKTEEKTEDVKTKEDDAFASTAEATPAAEPAKMEEAAPPAEAADTTPPPAAAEVTEEKTIMEDGTKTVEAIEESILPAAASEVAPAAAEEKAEETAAPAAAETETAAAEEEEAPAAAEPPEEVFIWGVPLLGDEKGDTVLLKFLRARDFKVKDALAMIKNTVIWRKQFGTDALVEEDLQIPELEKAVFNHGFDKEGHPVCYNVFGKFEDKELYAKAFGDEEKREKFLRWRIQHLEKGIRQQLDFTPGAICSMVQVNDLKNTVRPGKREMRAAINKALTLLQDNYPEFVAKQIFINVPWWYLAYNRVISSIFTQRSKSKMVFAGPSRSADTLFKYIAPEQVPVQYGGLSKENDTDFTTGDVVSELTIKPTSKHIIEIPATEGSTLVWELRVLGWEVSYGAEFAPSAEDGYTVIIQKARKFALTDEPYIKNTFKIGEPGMVVLTIDNATYKKKKLLYRHKEKSSTEST